MPRHFRDDTGLTRREREAYVYALQGMNLREMSDRMGVNRARAHQLVNALIEREYLQRNEYQRIIPGPNAFEIEGL